jgi:hypothetical protein
LANSVALEPGAGVLLRSLRVLLLALHSVAIAYLTSSLDFLGVWPKQVLTRAGRRTRARIMPAEHALLTDTGQGRPGRT